jgi:spore coat protein A
LSNGQKFIQIGSDQGLLPSPVAENEILLAPAERKEVIIDFSDPSLWGQTIIVRNNAKIPFPNGETVDPKTDGLVMAFRVNKPLNPHIPLSKLPEKLRAPINPLAKNGPERQLLLFETEDEYGRIEPVLGTVHKGALHFEDPVTENIKLGDTEVWDLYNATEDAHPIHIHQVRFQPISRQKFKADINEKTGELSNIRLLGQPKKFELNEDGWKDTQIALPGEVTRVIARFDLPGEYVWHCHITSHEDHDMMRPFIVSDHPVASNSSGLKQQSAANYLRLYPNPAASFSTVEFKVAVQGRISVKVYDMQQREVKTIFEGEKAAGVHELTINTTGLPAGIYICRMISNNEVVQQRADRSKVRDFPRRTGKGAG